MTHASSKEYKPPMRELVPCRRPRKSFPIDSWGASLVFARAFARTDLLVSIALVLFLGLIVFANVAAIPGSTSRRVVCLSNQGLLVRAWLDYANERNGALVGNLDGGSVLDLSNSNKTWVLGWLEAGLFTPANTNQVFLTQLSPLAPYLGRNAAPFRCPAETALSRGITGQPLVRNISMNGYLGPRRGPYSTGFRQFVSLSEFAYSSPNQAMVFIEERPDSLNDGWFIINMSGSDPLAPDAQQIVDYPGFRHENGAALSFADGHADVWKWSDRRTVPGYRAGVSMPLGVSSPGNADLARLQRAASVRVR